MTVVVNGENKDLSDGASIVDLLRSMGLDKAACAVEVNKKLIPKAQHPAQTLAHGDRVEVVTLIGGG